MKIRIIMAKYRKKPIVIEAIQITKELILIWAHNKIEKPKEICELDIWWSDDRIDDNMSTFSGKVNTSEGPMTFHAGDWLITGIAGEKYACKDEIFKATYELVE
jgi:hypothetical protein